MRALRSCDRPRSSELPAHPDSANRPEVPAWLLPARVRSLVAMSAAFALAAAMALALPGSAAAAPARSAAAAPPPPAASPANVRQACATPAKKGQMQCLALARTDVRSGTGVVPNAAPSGYGPADLASAYGLPSSGGQHATVAIIDAYDDPNAEADLGVYRAQYGLPPCTSANGCFTKLAPGRVDELPGAGSAAGRLDGGDLARPRHGLGGVPGLPHRPGRGEPADHGRPRHRREPGGGPGRAVRLQLLRRIRGSLGHGRRHQVLRPSGRGDHGQFG